ncbi:MAG TPA: nucleotide sugar dehydrogenase [Vicinamibacterales bacterium]|nr:nucleotide sugar dehydrogenase [Vicinamibacterales bacterium]
MLSETPVVVGVVGLGYVGLPLACAFARCLPCIGFDISQDRVEALRRGHDATGAIAGDGLGAPLLRLTNDPALLREANFIIVAVPTPVDSSNKPNLGPLTAACDTVGRHLSRGALVVFESTVYPGVTEEICVPALEQASGLRCGHDFTVGYSPERINPGDPEHSLEKVVKVVAGSTPDVTALMARVYGLVVKAGVHRAPNIKTAEAAKVIENTQRDVNIALMNELAMIFHRAGIDTRAVLEAAETKWNFVPFRPGLVGGHCIGVDPYYLTYRAEALGYHPQVILSGRRINDSMGIYVAEQTVKLMIRAGKIVQDARVLVLGLTFKENVPDIRNTRVSDVIAELGRYGIAVDVFDPVVDAAEVAREMDVRLVSDPFMGAGHYDAVVIAVAHDAFTSRSADEFVALLREGHGGRVLVDVRGIIPRQAAESRGVAYWCL